AAYTYDDVDYTEEATETVTSDQMPSLSITKEADAQTYEAVGDVITYTFYVENTGDVTLTGVTVTDPMFPSLSCGPVTLSPGATNTCTAPYLITQADVDAGRVDNTANVTGYFGETQVTDTDSETVSYNNLPPAITCPATPVITPCSQEVSGLSAMISDPNDNIASLTWKMTGATEASSPATGINNLDSYTFAWGTTVVTYIVTDELGSSTYCSFTVTVTSCCETAYGFSSGSICFLEASKEYKFNNWGWTTPLSGEGPWLLDLWAAAGGCDRDNGYLAGYVFVTRDASDDKKIIVTYELNPGFAASEIHVYIGCEPYPKLKNGKYTTAPGSYTFTAEGLNMVTDLTVDFTGVTGDFYLIAHAVTCQTDESVDNPVTFGTVKADANCSGTDASKTRSLSVQNPEPYELNIYPNPFSTVVRFEFNMLYDSRVKVEIFRQNGSLAEVIIDEDLKQGDVRTVEFDATGYPRTLFLYKITTDYTVKSGILLRMK
ncbi:MAG: hypothetical protein K0B05_05030, partial [Bacteroidales bacterium]|nr:hypothetical protein [Bacteroidales bacterium]